MSISHYYVDINSIEGGGTHTCINIITASIFFLKYGTIKNFGGEKTLAILANYSNFPNYTVFCQFLQLP